MNSKDERFRNALNDALARCNVDVHKLTIKAVAGNVLVRGTVLSAGQKAQVATILQLCAEQGLSVSVNVSVMSATP